MNNDELNMNEEQLRLATSRVLPAGAKLETETAALREGFLTMGSALESTAGGLDEAALIDRLRPHCREKSEMRAKEVALPKARYRSLDVVIGIVLAASVLLAVGSFIVVSRQPDKSGEAVVAPVAPVQSDSLQGNSALPDVAPDTAMATGWVDPLDDEIALAQAEMQWLTSRGYGLDGSLSQVGWQLEALSQELGGGSL